jgi:hypothetical protein
MVEIMEMTEMYTSENGFYRLMTEQEKLEYLNAQAESAIELPPSSISMRQFKLQLLSDGTLDDVESSISTNTADDARKIQIEWEYETVVARASELFKFVAESLSFNEEQKNQFLVVAANL